MTPILGIWASAQQPALNATSFDSIATVTVGAGGSSSIDFTSIPGTYKHLQIRLIARMGTGAGPYANFMTFNSDTGSNYSTHALYGTGASVAASSNASQTKIQIWDYPGGGNTANVFGAGIIDILDYADTNKYKTTRNLGGYDANGSGEVFLSSGNWRNTNAITSITLTPENGNYSQYTYAALYGIKA